MHWQNVLVKKEIAENNPNIFKHLSTEFNGEQLEVLQTKWIFPYEYLDSFGCFNETTLTPYEMFYNRLTNSNIKQEENEHAKMYGINLIWKQLVIIMIYIWKLMYYY